MIRNFWKNAALGVALSALSRASYAAQVTWVLEDVTFASNQVLGQGPHDGTASGSFTYDADTNTYDNVNITTTGSNLWGTGTCSDAKCDTYIRATGLYAPLTSTSLQVTPTTTDPTDATGYYGASLQFVSGLTNAGGTVALFTAGGPDGEGICNNADCSGVSAFRGFSGGSVSAVPIPAAAWLFGSALLGLGALKRRKA
jgi:hypothetical protein